MTQILTYGKLNGKNDVEGKIVTRSILNTTLQVLLNLKIKLCSNQRHKMNTHIYTYIYLCFEIVIY